MRLRVCRVDLTVHGREWARRFGPGQRVDLDELLAPGVRVADGIAGREACFEMESPVPAAGIDQQPHVVEPFPDDEG